MIEHGAATLPRPGSGRAADLLLLPDRGVFGLAVSSGPNGLWAAQRSLAALRERSADLAAIASRIDGGADEAPELLGLLQDAFDHAAWLLYEEAVDRGETAQANLAAVVTNGARVWLAVSGQCVVGRSEADQRAIDAMPLGVMARSQPELFEERIGPGQDLILSSSALVGATSGRLGPEPYARALASRLEGGQEQAVLVLRGDAAQHSSDVLGAVRGTRLLGGLDPRALDRVRPYLLESTVSAGDTVFQEGDAGDRLYVVLRGELEVTRGDVVLTQLGAGDHFGELALHLAGRRTATVRASSDAWLVSLHRRHLRELAERRPEVATGLLQVLLRDVAERLNDLTERVRE